MDTNLKAFLTLNTPDENETFKMKNKSTGF